MLDEDLCPEQEAEIESSVNIFLAKFNQSQKDQAINFTLMPVNHILKYPKEQKWRNVDIDSHFLKKVGEMNKNALGPLLLALGFTKVSEKQYKF